MVNSLFMKTLSAIFWREFIADKEEKEMEVVEAFSKS